MKIMLVIIPVLMLSIPAVAFGVLLELVYSGTGLIGWLAVWIVEVAWLTVSAQININTMIE